MEGFPSQATRGFVHFCIHQAPISKSPQLMRKRKVKQRWAITLGHCFVCHLPVASGNGPVAVIHKEHCHLHWFLLK